MVLTSNFPLPLLDNPFMNPAGKILIKFYTDLHSGCSYRFKGQSIPGIYGDFISNWSATEDNDLDFLLADILLLKAIVGAGSGLALFSVEGIQTII